MYTADAIQGIVVENHNLPILGQLNIQLHTVARAPCQAESLERVLRNAPVLAVETTMGKVSPDEGGLLAICGSTRREKKHRQACRHNSTGAEKRGSFQLVGNRLEHNGHLKSKYAFSRGYTIQSPSSASRPTTFSTLRALIFLTSAVNTIKDRTVSTQE